MILVRVPGLDNPAALAATNPAPVNHIGRYAEAGQPVVVIDTTTGERWPIWTEIDSNATTPGDTLVEIHPARNFIGGHRYIVAMRKLKTASGQTIGAPAGFRYYRDDLPSNKAAIDRSAAASRGSSTSCASRASSARTCTSPGTSRSRAT